ncbi:MAG: hypothetical protein GKR89_10045 [Candidatus Latescibacteria bacterium]|nr:hypothetical protein [Candidatus Latescibacterota bacterium]
MGKEIDKARIARVARVYKNNTDAARALGIAKQSFGRLCRKYAIESPWERRQRQMSESRQPAAG